MRRLGAPDAAPGDAAGSQAVEVTGTVVELLPKALCRVMAEGQREVVAHTASGTGRNFVRLVVGDRVLVQLSPQDLGRGRIVRRLGQGIR